jgi:hypothetical protein
VSTLGEDSAPIEFFVPGNGEDYLDPSRMQLYVKVKVKAADGENIGGDDQVGPQNLFLQSLFSQVNVSLNDKLVTPSATTHSYRAMIETLERLRYPGFGVRVRVVSSCFTDVCNSIILFLFSCNRQCYNAKNVHLNCE